MQVVVRITCFVLALPSFISENTRVCMDHMCLLYGSCMDLRSFLQGRSREGPNTDQVDIRQQRGTCNITTNHREPPPRNGHAPVQTTGIYMRLAWIANSCFLLLPASSCISRCISACIRAVPVPSSVHCPIPSVQSPHIRSCTHLPATSHHLEAALQENLQASWSWSWSRSISHTESLAHC
jgi:hypothetical protein